MGFTLLPPLLADEESGELVFDTYSPWFFPEHYRLLITPSHYMVLGSITDLYEDDEITEAQAKLCESAFVLNAWTWVDRPERNKPTQQQQMMRALLLKDGTDDEEEGKEE